MLSPVETVVELIVVVVPLTVKSPFITTSLLNVLAPAIVCVPLVLTTVLSTSRLLALAVRPSPPTTLITPVLSVKPLPATLLWILNVNVPAVSLYTALTPAPSVTKLATLSSTLSSV